MSRTTKPATGPAPANSQASVPGVETEAEQEAARLAAEQEAARLAAEQEAARLAAEQEAARLAAEQEAARLAAEQGAARLAAEQEAARLAAEKAEADRIAAAPVDVAMLRRDAIEGIWYAAGAVVALPRRLVQALEPDGAIETAEASVQYALANGATRIVHVTPDAHEVQTPALDQLDA